MPGRDLGRSSAGSVRLVRCCTAGDLDPGRRFAPAGQARPAGQAALQSREIAPADAGAPSQLVLRPVQIGIEYCKKFCRSGTRLLVTESLIVIGTKPLRYAVMK